MTTPADVAGRVAANQQALARFATAADAKELARLLVALKAITDALKDADAEVRDQARQIFESGDAATARRGDEELGRVRRDRPAEEWYVHDWAAYDAWARANVPEACNAVAPWLLKAIKRDGGVFIRKGTGEIFEPAGLGLKRGEGNLVVTTTDAAEDWARDLVLRSARGELE